MRENRLQLIYLLPNLFTAGSVFVGVISIINSAKGHFTHAAGFIFLALIFDGLDGRIARFTKTTSKFGAEFDSLADIVSFGVAPAMLFYFSMGDEYGRVGSLAAAMYVVFGAVRLARFNVTSASIEPSVFIGVPIPTAAVFSVSWVLIAFELESSFFNFLVLINIFLISLLMVSNIRYPSFKKIDFNKANFRKVLILMILIFSLIYLNPVVALFMGSTSYVIYGIVRGFYHFVLRKRGKS
ncbi:MAG: CDP-diacylglycerol--serine O-phosphatidyltransferase [Epsilonproteobacteria bacterium]|nr:CDP-diacylglycerol--serine O-phosphatidyltransferase [Campylobacterota bacterium]